MMVRIREQVRIQSQKNAARERRRYKGWVNRVPPSRVALHDQVHEPVQNLIGEAIGDSRTVRSGSLTHWGGNSESDFEAGRTDLEDRGRKVAVLRGKCLFSSVTGPQRL